jgi:hypothetical protein
MKTPNKALKRIGQKAGLPLSSAFDDRNKESKGMAENLKEIIHGFVDYVMPELTPYESTLYLLLLRLSHLSDGSPRVRIGKRRIAKQIGKSPQTAGLVSYEQITKVCKALEEKTCIVVGDTTREGTLYTVIVPQEIPFVKEKMAVVSVSDDDYFNDPVKRQELFERDNWTCQYCGEKVTEESATLDHYIPQSKGGNHSKGNLRTCCLLCNSIKSGTFFEEAAPHILRSMQERRQRRSE